MPVNARLHAVLTSSNQSDDRALGRPCARVGIPL